MFDEKDVGMEIWAGQGDMLYVYVEDYTLTPSVPPSFAPHTHNSLIDLMHLLFTDTPPVPIFAAFLF